MELHLYIPVKKTNQTFDQYPHAEQMVYRTERNHIPFHTALFEGTFLHDWDEKLSKLPVRCFLKMHTSLKIPDHVIAPHPNQNILRCSKLLFHPHSQIPLPF